MGEEQWEQEALMVELGHCVPTGAIVQRPPNVAYGHNNLNKMSHSAAISHIIGELSLGGKRKGMKWSQNSLTAVNFQIVHVVPYA